MMNKLNYICMVSLLITVMVSPPGSYANGNIKITGRYISSACTLMPGSENIDVEFGTIIDKYLYRNVKSSPESFVISLTDCKPEVADSVKIQFTGTENTALPGYLAINSEGGASGIGIAILDNEKKLLPINTAFSEHKIENTEMDIKFYTFIEAEPEAIKHHNIGRGEFIASATFMLSYD